MVEENPIGDTKLCNTSLEDPMKISHKSGMHKRKRFSYHTSTEKYSQYEAKILQ